MGDMPTSKSVWHLGKEAAPMKERCVDIVHCTQCQNKQPKEEGAVARTPSTKTSIMRNMEKNHGKTE